MSIRSPKKARSRSSREGCEKRRSKKEGLRRGPEISSVVARKIEELTSASANHDTLAERGDSIRDHEEPGPSRRVKSSVDWSSDDELLFGVGGPLGYQLDVTLVHVYSMGRIA